MSLEANTSWRRATRFRAVLSFYFVAFAQFLSPAAATDPASKIDPPTWSHHHSLKEVQAYGTRVQTRESERKTQRGLSQIKLRRLLDQPRGRDRAS